MHSQTHFFFLLQILKLQKGVIHVVTRTKGVVQRSEPECRDLQCTGNKSQLQHIQSIDGFIYII